MVKVLVIGVFSLALGGGPPAAAQDTGCEYLGRRFPEGSRICQAGLEQTCMNGSWQSLDGTRCSTEDAQESGGPERPEGASNAE